MNVAPPEVAADLIGAFVSTSQIARDLARKSPRSINKWVKRGDFPPPDAVLNGRQLWRRETYLAWKERLLAKQLESISRASAA